MPASPSRPTPAPATPPPSAVATPRRRRRLLQAGKPNHHSPSPSLQAAPASPFSLFPPTSTSPSPFHRFLPSPLRASAVPFSWEHRPGIPKTPARNRSNSKGNNSKALPLPPSLLARSCAGGSDPYASVVPAEYATAMDPPPKRWRVRVRRTRRRSPSRLGDALAEWLSMLSLYRSCKRAAACFAAKAKSPAA
ncbi:vegetative cell wall protein gp1-like [Miscanthus floridulus]|uniref:vegetative cell wall protein gp1-like n=1 Tax=Miscanthus floridulus TaxID=154761 RepID=UPI003459C0A6